jgi:hypothetical protein
MASLQPGPRPAAPLVVAGRTPDEIVAGSGLRSSTIAAAFGCSPVIVWRWRAGIAVPSARPGTAGYRFRVLLSALAAADTHHDQAVAEAAAMDNGGRGDRWAKYDAGWVWVGAPEDPRVVRAAGRRRARVVLRDGVPEPRRAVDPAGVGVASGAHRGPVGVQGAGARGV